MGDAMSESSTPAPPKTTPKLPVVKSLPSSQNGDAIARLLVEQNLITEEQLIYAKRVKAKLISDRSLVEILKELRLLTNQQLNQVLKQQRLSALESQLREARSHQEEMEQEIEHMEAIAQSYFEGRDSGDFDADPLNDTQQKELEFMRQQKSNLQTRLQAQRATVIDLENDLMRAREDVLALEETVDEQLGLR